MIHPSAIISEGASIGNNVEIGPFSIIEENVTIGDNCVIGSNTLITGWTTIGHNNHIGHGVIIGQEPPDHKFQGEKSYVQIGNHNKIWEFTTIHRGTEFGGGVTSIGDGNTIMAYVHIAHDCKINNKVRITNGVQMAGHVEVDDYAVIGGMSGIHQWVRIGKMVMVGGMSGVRQDVLPYTLVAGTPCRTYGLNVVGMKRNQLETQAIRDLHSAYKMIYRRGMNIEEAIEKLDERYPEHPQIQEIVSFFKESKRGITGQSNQMLV